MNKLVETIAEQTSGKSLKSFRYSVDPIEKPDIHYPDEEETAVVFSPKELGETDNSIKKSRDLTERVRKIKNDNDTPLMKYFMDGSRKTYKIDDIAYESKRKIYPLLAGQIGTACCERTEQTIKKYKLVQGLILALPESSDKDDDGDLFFSQLRKVLNQQISSFNFKFHILEIVAYKDALGKGEKYEHRAIARIHDEMIKLEKEIVRCIVKENLLGPDSYLLKDGSLEYSKKGVYDEAYKWDRIKNNYRYVIGVSKSFNPEIAKDPRGKSNSLQIANLPLYHRTPAYMYSTEVTGNVKFCVWYLRIREFSKTKGPFDGIVKVEKVLVTESEEQDGLESDEIDLISANLVNERNPTVYGKDDRWANHLYPIYLTEKLIKASFFSDQFILSTF